MRSCPYCAEQIQDEAVICRYCGRSVTTGGAGQTLPTPVSGPRFQLWPATLGLAGALIAAAPMVFPWSQYFTPISLDLTGNALGVFGSILGFWGPLAIALVSAVLILTGSRVAFLPGLLLGSGAATLAFPASQLLYSLSYDSGWYPAPLIISLAGSVVLATGGVFAVLGDSRSNSNPVARTSS
jgi:zinc-ribbon domain